MHNYIQNKGNAYQAAISAGYSKKYADRNSKRILGNVGVHRLIHARMHAVRQRNRRHDISDLSVLENLYKIASGSIKKSHYQMTDLKHPEESTDQKFTGPSATREQVQAIDLVLKYKGLEHESSKKLEKAKTDKANAETKTLRIKSKMINKIDHLKLVLARAKIRKTQAEAKIKQLIAKQSDTKNNQTISKVDELLDRIFDDKK